MMKKEEAEQLICPFMQMSESEDIVHASESKNITCITDNCMAWKETYEEKTSSHKWTTTKNEVFIKYIENGLKNAGDMVYRNKTSISGYCIRLS